MSLWGFCWRSWLALIIIGTLGALAVQGMFWLNAP